MTGRINKSNNILPRVGFRSALIGTVILALFALSAWAATSVPQGKLLLGLTTRDKLFSVDFRDTSQGLVVGDVGFILETKDGGTTWTQYKNKEKIGTDPLFDVFLTGPKAGWIVGKKGLILHTSDGGVTWEKQKSGTQNDLMAVRFTDEKRGFIAGSYGIILQTSDGGTTWKTYSINWEKELKDVMERSGLASPHLYDICFPNEKQGWIVGENGVILHTTDGGLNWNMSQGGLLPPLFSLSFNGPSQGWAVGQNGYVVATQDGKTWKKVQVNTKESLFRIRMNQGSGFMVGEWGTILVTQDGGKTWTARNEEDRETMIGISFPANTKHAIVLGAKTIKRIEMGGK